MRRPAHTEVAALAVDAFTLVELKEALGIPEDDDTLDGEVRAVGRAAQEWVTARLDRTWSRTERTDRYAGWPADRRLKLSAEPRGDSATVYYRDAEDTRRTVQATAYIVDKAAAAVAFRDAPALELSSLRRLPVEVVYESGIDAGTGADSGENAIAQAIKIAARSLFGRTPGAQPWSIARRQIEELIAPWIPVTL